LSVPVLRSPRRDMEKIKIARGDDLLSRYHELLSRYHDIFLSFSHAKITRDDKIVTHYHEFTCRFHELRVTISLPRVIFCFFSPRGLHTVPYGRKNGNKIRQLNEHERKLQITRISIILL